MNSTRHERRREKRNATTGELRLAIEEPAEEIFGRLVDTSRSGFRAVHQYAGLSAGQEVGFRHALARGKARVMWTRVLGADVESGFLILTPNA